MNRLELMRYDRGLTRAEVAERSGVSIRTLQNLETGNARPSAPTAKALADFYEVSVADLLGIETAA